MPFSRLVVSANSIENFRVDTKRKKNSLSKQEKWQEFFPRSFWNKSLWSPQIPVQHFISFQSDRTWAKRNLRNHFRDTHTKMKSRKNAFKQNAIREIVFHLNSLFVVFLYLCFEIRSVRRSSIRFHHRIDWPIVIFYCPIKFEQWSTVK